jgi:HEAT repeat protein
MSYDIESLLAVVRSGEREEIWEAAKRLESLILDLKVSLNRILWEGASPEARSAAAYVLGFARFADARTNLEQVLSDTNQDQAVRGHAAEALAYLMSRDSVQVLLRNLEDSSPGVRYRCMFSLGQIGDPSAIPALERAADHLGEEQYDGHSLQSEALNAISSIRGSW